MEQYYQQYYSSHYAQAYAQYQSHNLAFVPQNLQSQQPAHSISQMSSWYQHGTDRCSHKGCQFLGSKKSVELHMMDRHLIYPHGWDNKKSSTGWDADPS